MDAGIYLYTDLMSAINWHSFFIASDTPLLHQLIQLHSLLDLQALRINMTNTINDLIYKIVANRNKTKEPRYKHRSSMTKDNINRFIKIIKFGVVLILEQLKYSMHLLTNQTIPLLKLKKHHSKAF